MRIARHFAIVIALLFSAASAIAQVPYERILHSDKEPQNWLTYGGNYASQRFSGLKQITPQNASALRMTWVYQMRGGGALESTPIVVDGIMYVTEPPSNVTALDAHTGKTLWHYDPVIPRDLVAIGLFPTNRGVAVLNDKVYVATIDARLIALDAKSGVVRWITRIADNKDDGYAITQAPLAINGKIIVGVGGGEAGAHGFLSAYDAKTGKLLWRLFTVPQSPADPGADTWANGSWSNGGGTTWNTGSYDPETNTLYWGTGNPAPDWNGEGRMGDNLFTCSLIAVDADTGKMKWYFQFTPHETHDWDSSEPPVLFNATIDGKPRKLVALANRNAFYYVLDRVTGQFLLGVPFAKQPGPRDSTPKAAPSIIPRRKSSQAWKARWSIHRSLARSIGRAPATARSRVSFTWTRARAALTTSRASRRWRPEIRWAWLAGAAAAGSLWSAIKSTPRFARSMQPPASGSGNSRWSATRGPARSSRRAAWFSRPMRAAISSRSTPRRAPPNGTCSWAPLCGRIR